MTGEGRNKFFMKKIIIIFFLAFGLNFIWEISQSFLYTPHFSGTTNFITVHLRASLGDVLMIFIILSLDAFILGRVFHQKPKKVRLLAIACTGFVLALAVEKYALASGRWSYNSLMPIIPGLNVGLTPIFQMILFPLIIFLFWSQLKKN